MQIKPILIVLLISSSLLILPLIKPNTEITLFPFEKNSIVINIQTSNIRITSDIDAFIQLNFSRLDPQTNSIKLIFANEIGNLREFKIDKRGNHLFEFLIEILAIVTVTINQYGLPPSSIFAILGIVILGAAYFLKRLIFPPIDV